MSAWIWVLSFTILGTSSEHGYMAKFKTRDECEQTLILLKEEAKKQKKSLVGTCTKTLREGKIYT